MYLYKLVFDGVDLFFGGGKAARAGVNLQIETVNFGLGQSSSTCGTQNALGVAVAHRFVRLIEAMIAQNVATMSSHERFTVQF